MNTGVHRARDDTGRPPAWGLSNEDKNKQEWEARDEEMRGLLGKLKRAMSNVVEVEIDARLAM
ncbi:hypothetical protein Ct61P_15211 [Colletotrichum tofieldiae]|nr:hypothetical protein Ct61P_15211 [Colletotrichum tofieldiae]